MIYAVDREEVLKHEPLANYVARIQADQIVDQLEFASSNQERGAIKSVYDMASSYTANDIDHLTEQVMYHPEDDLHLYPSLLGSSLGYFLVNDEVDRLFMLPHLRKSICSTMNTDNQPLSLIRARELLLEVTGDRHYSGAYAADENSFSALVEAVFWLTRYDASIPEYIFLYPNYANYFISVCRYGNLHFYMHSKEQARLMANLKNAGLVAWEGAECERFSTSSAVDGRLTEP